MALDNPHATPHDRADGPPVPAGRDESLPCGRSVRRAWEQTRAGRAADAHAARCPYCRQAADGLAALDRAAGTLRGRGPVGRTVADRVMRAVRAEVRLGRLVPLDDAGRELRIAEAAVAKVLRNSADRIPGVRAASCRLTPTGRGAEVSVAMTLAMSLDAPMRDRAARVRRAVLDAARRELGIAPGRIDLTVVSVTAPDSGSVSGGSGPEGGGGP